MLVRQRGQTRVLRHVPGHMFVANCTAYHSSYTVEALNFRPRPCAVAGVQQQCGCMLCLESEGNQEPMRFNELLGVFLPEYESGNR